jgi:hypothetical protein
MIHRLYLPWNFQDYTALLRTTLNFSYTSQYPGIGLYGEQADSLIARAATALSELAEPTELPELK